MWEVKSGYKRLGSVKIYNSRSEYPFVRKVRMREGGGGG